MLCFTTIKEIVRLWQGISWLLYTPLEIFPSFQLLLKILSRFSHSPAICVHKNVLKLKNDHPSFQYHLQLNNLIFLLVFFCFCFFEGSMSSFHVFLQVPIGLFLISLLGLMDYVKPTATKHN